MRPCHASAEWQTAAQGRRPPAQAAVTAHGVARHLGYDVAERLLHARAPAIETGDHQAAGGDGDFLPVGASVRRTRCRGSFTRRRSHKNHLADLLKIVTRLWAASTTAPTGAPEHQTVDKPPASLPAASPRGLLHGIPE